MHKTGFQTIRLGLETSDISLHGKLDNKLSMGDFERAIHNLLRAGFDTKKIGAYILIGLPGQTVDSVIETINFVGANGAIPYLSEYSPIPHTPMWNKALTCSEYDLASEPLFHNNTLLPCWDESKKRDLPMVRRLVSQIRDRYR